MNAFGSSLVAAPRITVSLFLALASLAGACGGGGGDDDSRPAPAPVTSATEFATRFCEALQPCCGMVGLSPGAETCRAQLTVVAARSDFDPGAATRCLAAVSAEVARPGAPFCQSGESPVVEAACESVYPTKPTGAGKQPGETCEEDGDCVRPVNGYAECAYEPSSSAQGPGGTVCVLRLRGTVGSAPCVATIDGSSAEAAAGAPKGTTTYTCDRADGVACDFWTNACTPLAGAGGPCTSSKACVDGAFCDLATKACTPVGALGAPCTQPDACAAGNRCREGVCSPLANEGDTCELASDCASGRCKSSHCGSAKDAIAMFCSPR